MANLYEQTFFTAFLLVLANNFCFAQPNQHSSSGGQAAWQPVIGPAPTTASLGSFGNIAGDLNAGVATVSIPLVEVKGRKLSVPVSLNYRTTGLRVNEMAGWTGLGWMLNAGGCITRTVRGLPDESGPTAIPAGYHTTDAADLFQLLLDPSYARFNCDKSSHYVDKNHALDNKCGRTLRGEYDTEPDVFSYSFGGYSGTIYFTQDETPVLIPHREWDVRRIDFDENTLSLSLGSSSSFQITTEDGTQYAFEAVERTTPTDQSIPLTQSVITAWYLTRVTAAEINEHITLSYGGTDVQNTASRANSIDQVVVRIPLSVTCPRDSGISDAYDGVIVQGSNYPIRHSIVFLSRIESSTALLTFYSNANRTDIGGGDIQVPSLDSLAWTDKLTGQRRRFQFTYDYFITASGSRPEELRLKLVAMREVGKPPHRFFYNSVALPARDSYARDHWNFFNGQNNNTSLIPALNQDYTRRFGSNNLAQAVRESVGLYARACILEKVVYPTGGNTRFEFEANFVKKEVGQDLLGELGAGSAGGPTHSEIRVQGGSISSTTPQALWKAADEYYNDPGHGGGTGGALPRLIDRTLVALTVIHLPYGATNVHMEVRLTRPVGQVLSGQTTSGGFLLKLCPGKLSSGAFTFSNLIYNQIAAQERPITLLTQIPLRPFIDECTHRRTSVLDSGYYVLYSVLSDGLTAPSSVSITSFLYYTENPPPSGNLGNRLVGGVRMVRMIDTPLIGPPITTSYNYNEPTTSGDSLTQKSSGHLFFEPKYDKISYCGHLVLTAYNQSYRGVLHDGYHIGYQYVTETKEGLPNGRTLHEYYNRDVVNNNSQHRSWPVLERQYSTSGKVLHETANTYTLFPDAQPLIKGVQVEKYVRYLEGYRPANPPLGASYIADVTDYCFPSYTISSTLLLPGSKQERHYDIAGGLAWQKKTTYRYGLNAAGKHHTTATEEHELLVPFTAPGSPAKGDSTVVKISFADDYLPPPPPGTTAAAVGDGPTEGIWGLQNSHVLTAPVERVHYRKGLVAYAQCYTYTGLKLAKVLELQLAAPVNNFTSSSVTSTVSSGQFNGRFSLDSRYVATSLYDRYSLTGNLLQRHRPGQQGFDSFVWGYAESEPIAEVQNAAVNNIAYTSFEPYSAGTWDYNSVTTGARPLVPSPKVGRWAYELSSSGTRPVSRGALGAGRYEVSYWFQGVDPALYVGTQLAAQQAGYTSEVLATAPNNWQQVRKRFDVPTNGTVALKYGTGVALLDELRLHPVGAQMTSYTYDPLVGMTSQTDATGRTTTYEYDGLGRLLRTRDEQGRVLSQNEYRYARP